LCSTRKAAFLILGALFYLFFRGIGDHGLLDPLEGLNASVALNMVAQRNFTAPLAENLPYAGATMGYWWLSGAALALFGWLEFSVRFWPAAGGIGMAAVSWFIVRRTNDECAANYAAVLTGTSLLTYAASQLAIPHTLYACFTSMALAGIVYGFQNRRFFLLLHVSAMLAFIVHGPSGAILPWLSFLIYAYFAEGERFFLGAVFYWPGLLATVLLGGGYLFFLHIANPTVLTLMRYNLAAPAFDSFSSALLFLSFACFPWVGVLPEALKNAFPHNRYLILPSERAKVLFLTWAGVFLLFGFFSSDAFLLVAPIPALTILCSIHLADAVNKNNTNLFRRTIVMEILLCVLLLFVVVPGIYINSLKKIWGTLLSVVPWMFFCLLFLLAGWHYAKTRQPRKFMLHLCAVSLLSLMPLAGVFNLLAEELSIRDAGLYLRNELSQDDILAQYFMNHPSLYFYTAKESLLIHAPTVPRVAGQQVLSEQALNQIWGNTRRVFLLIGREQEFLVPLPPEVHNLYETHDLVVLSNRRDSPLSGPNILAIPRE
jgi:4-amino-4-deoxy-L-arabinose transferase-like glycosyltransferase